MTFWVTIIRTCHVSRSAPRAMSKVWVRDIQKRIERVIFRCAPSSWHSDVHWICVIEMTYWDTLSRGWRSMPTRVWVRVAFRCALSSWDLDSIEIEMTYWDTLIRSRHVSRSECRQECEFATFRCILSSCDLDDLLSHANSSRVMLSTQSDVESVSLWYSDVRWVREI